MDGLRFVVVLLSELAQDPVKVIGDVYAQLKLEMSTQYAGKLASFAATKMQKPQTYEHVSVPANWACLLDVYGSEAPNLKSRLLTQTSGGSLQALRPERILLLIRSTPLSKRRRLLRCVRETQQKKRRLE